MNVGSTTCGGETGNTRCRVAAVTVKKRAEAHPREVHPQFELGQQVKDDAPLVVQDAQVLLVVVLRVRHLLTGTDVLQPGVVLPKHEQKHKLLPFQS